MTTKESEQRGWFPWRKRADFVPGKTRRQRQAQYKDQMNMLLLVLVASAVAAGLVVIINYQGAGSVKSVSCNNFPQYCVPFAGGVEDGQYASLEAPESRELDGDLQVADGVVRGVWNDLVPVVGDPKAPIHFVTFSDFACSHCQEFHRGDLERFVESYVLSGQATVGFVMLTGTGGGYSRLASQAALCAGEQGAFWEISSEFFRLGRAMGAANAFSLEQIKSTAEDMGLDSEKLVNCVASNRYGRFIDENLLFAQDVGVTGTPNVYVRYGDSDQWSRVDRDYGTLANLTEEANRGASE
jgi:protein-disulfide isomerase